jgi:outer membrane protein OmpA-like peptidoglycan-associated protein
MKLTLITVVGLAFAATACTKTVVLKEDSPLRVTASPPAPPPPPSEPPKRVEVKKEKIQVNDVILFEFGKAVIRDESFGLLDEIGDVITKHPEVLKIRIEGHTDSVGTPRYNLNLSRKRAQAVLDYLVGKGVATERLTSEGFGLAKPVADNDTDEGRSKNRRVEFNIVERADESGDAAAADGDAAADDSAAAAAGDGAADGASKGGDQ